MFLSKLAFTSSASRNVSKLTSNWLNQPLHKLLSWRKISKGGRGSTGRRILLSRGSLGRRLRHPQINYNPRFQVLSLVGSFFLVPFQNKLTSLTFLSSGGVSYLPTTLKQSIFSILAPYSKPISKYRLFSPLITFSPVMYLPLLSRLCLLELYPGLGIQYVRSSGCYARFLKIDWNNHTAQIELPSGVRKAFSLYSIGFSGSNSLKSKNLLRNTKSGYWRSFGRKSKVRGVAMNPVDHPHGGRTKAIKNPRTPWGKVAKYK